MSRQDLKKLLEQISNQISSTSNEEDVKKYKKDIIDIIFNLTEEDQIELLMDVDFVANKLHFLIDTSKIIDLIRGIQSEQKQKKIVDMYQDQLLLYQKAYIISKFKENYKIEILLNDKNLDRFDKTIILQSLEINTLSAFLSEHRKYITENNIHPYEFIGFWDIESQEEFITNLHKMNLTLKEKKEILAFLGDEIKQKIITTNLAEEYKLALSMKKAEKGKIVLDLERRLEDYRGLDNLLRVNPENLTEEQRKKLIELCDICPDMEVVSVVSGVEWVSTGSEYKKGEEWINSLLSSLNPEYSKAQKMAKIDNAIGKKISYSPDWKTEIADHNKCRAIWKIICTGYGVCNGIACLEKYIFDRVGIESEIVEGDEHAFLKIKNIELPLANGELVKGNTIIDPTWNLVNHRYNARPNNFCINYEQARENDVDEKGRDSESHKNDKQLKDATLALDDKSLRKLFTSVGLADKNGDFPIKDMFIESELLDEIYANDTEKNINKQLLLLSLTCPEFATCQNSSMKILSDMIFYCKNLKFRRCSVNRVYSKTDEEKSPIFYLYIETNEFGKKFYYADKNERKFIELAPEQFVSQFECYEEDLKKRNGIRPWENKESKVTHRNTTEVQTSEREG